MLCCVHFEISACRLFASLAASALQQRVLKCLEGFFLNARDVTAADPALCGDLALRQRRVAVKTIPQRDDQLLARREDTLDQRTELPVQLARAELLKQVLLRADRVEQRKRIAIAPRLNAV